MVERPGDVPLESNATGHREALFKQAPRARVRALGVGNTPQVMERQHQSPAIADRAAKGEAFVEVGLSLFVFALIVGGPAELMQGPANSPDIVELPKQGQ